MGVTNMGVDVSIIIPNRNYGRFIADAIKSVRNQTLKSWECIIIDDASDDNSVQVIKREIAGDKRFRIIVNDTPIGVSCARNMGLDVACGDYIAFLDSDDCYTQYALEMLLHLAKTTNTDMVGGRAMIVPAIYKYMPVKNLTWTPESINLTDDPSAFLLMAKTHNWCWIWRRIYKRELIGDTRFPPEMKNFGDDLCFMLAIAHKAKTMAEVQNVTVYHRLHSDAITGPAKTTARFEWFPSYFKYIQDFILDKYDAGFLKKFYNSNLPYLIHETIIVPHLSGKYKHEAKDALVESFKLIPRHYLRFKYRLMGWYLSWIK